MKGFDRRRFLIGTAGALVALPFLPSRFGGGLARAATAPKPPKRFIAMFTPLGSRPDAWDAPTGSLTSANLPSPLTPLGAHAADILLLEGINYTVTYGGTQYGGAHQRGIACAFTGHQLQSGDFGGGNGAPLSGFANGPSLDQVLAREIGTGTPFSNIALGVQNDATDLPNIARMVFSSAGVVVPAIEDPVYAFNRLFGSLPTGSGPNPALLREKSVLDGAVAELQAINPRLAAADKAKLDSHLTELRSLETRLQNLMDAPSCAAGTAPPAVSLTSNDSFPVIGDVMMSLIVKAFECDLTRVASLQWSRAGSNTFHSWASTGSVTINDKHHAISHVGSSEPGRSQMIAINQWYAKQFATFLDRLKAVTQSDGTNLLDNSAILWTTDVGDGDKHTRQDVPTILAGKCQGAFHPGRAIQANAPNNKLLAAVSSAMGLPASSFGDSKFPGILTGL